ncbi:hypothetical protein MNBD_GAMMA22-988 [hydrothermal vent metagenome]|uniref:Inner membrane protein YgaP-like transmembrane domain-containing protein n=1 Tax=hydrothermal vent metagenome TaxID=652676 RepID=A0A3B1B796_9ZZZZ
MGNIGGIDRAGRIIIGLISISLVFVGPQNIFGWLGALPLVTGLFAYCPIYKLLGLSTCRFH